MNIRELWIVLSKEIKDALRDRRSVTAGLLFAALGPLVMSAALNSMIDSGADKKNAAVLLVGAERAAGLAAHLAAEGVTVTPSTGKPEELMAAQPLAIVLAVTQRNADDFSALRTARIELWADMSDSKVRTRVERVQALVGSYGEQVAVQRMLARGIEPGVARPLGVEMRDFASQGTRAALVLGMLPMFWIMGIFIGGTNIAIDVTGGERERRSLEALLAQPASAATLFTGKWLAASLFGYVTAAATVLVSLKLLSGLPLYELGIAFSLDGAQLAALLLALVPLALLAAAMQCALALQARTFKEAQTYLNLLQLLPMALVVVQFKGSSPSTATWIAPMFSHQAQLSAILAGKALSMPLLAASLGVTAVAAGLLAWLGSRRLGSERFVFGL